MPPGDEPTEPPGQRQRALERHRTGGRTPIVFVHGAMMGRSVWWPQVRALSDRFRCITVDQPGHGSRKDQKFTLDIAVANVLEALESETDGRAVLVGLSLGGYVAMTVAARHPARSAAS